MARPSRNRAPDELVTHVDIDHDALNQAHQALDVHAQQLAIIGDRYSPGLPYQFDLYVSRARDLFTEANLRYLEIGLILIQLREREEEGQWHRALERIGIAPRAARRFIKTAELFGSDAKRKQLASQLGSAKMLEFLSEEDDDIAELADGGTLAGYTADELSQMTARELRELLRKERAEREEEKAADEEIIQKKDERINKLMRDRRKVGNSPIRDQVRPEIEEMDALAVDVGAALTKMAELAQAIEHAFAEAGEATPADVIERIDQNRQFAADWLRTVCEALGE